jgi:SAM-dependent methyltransferase
MSWNEGYVTDIDYTYGHYAELEPHRALFVLTYAGYSTPKLENACEIGFGQGISLNINAAGSDIHWYGNDFNPNQVANAQRLSEMFESEMQIFDDDFLSFLNRNNLPKFDFISLHGIWSWVSDQNREIIKEIIKTKLNVGGIVYISYNTLPGWNQMIPIRNLMMDVMEANTSGMELSNNRVEKTLASMTDFLNLNPKYFAQNPAGKKKLEDLTTQNKNYVAHEYFNRDWKAMNFSDAAKILDDAKISYVASANLLENLDVLNLSQEQSKYLSGIENQSLRETMRDYFLSQTFRKDYWIKGKLKLSAHERMIALDKFNLVAAKSLGDFNYKLTCNIGEANLTEDVYKPIVELMSDHKPRSIAVIRESLSSVNSISTEQILEALYILVGNGTLGLAFDQKIAKQRYQKTNRLNTYFMEKSVDATYVNYLVSPLTGSGIPVGRIEQIFIKLYTEKVENAKDLASKVQQILETRGQTLTIEGAAVEHGKALEGALLKAAQRFKDHLLPIYKSLMLL